LIHVSERIKAALSYFETDGRFGFRNPVETRRGEAHQEGEGFYDELIVLEELQTKAVLRLMKAKLLIETVVAAEPISKKINF
jgi:hypothetical protein